MMKSLEAPLADLSPLDVSVLLLVLAFGIFVLFLEFLVDCGLLVLLVLRYQVVHVGLGLCELHLVHAFARVPVQEGLPPEHGRELL